ncbi:exonuclease SbcC [Geomicrobium sp. JCM 19038]|nr:exonuclease SbcC [Geomicrobium sp. JCM 19038]
MTAKEVEKLASDYENVKNEQLTNQTKREDAVSRKQKAEQDWEEQKKGNAYQKLDSLISFERSDNLQLYRLTEAEVEQIDEAVERLHQQLSKVELHLERLNEQIGKDTISTEQYESVVVELQQSNERLEQLKEKRTNAQTALEQLIEKHERYTELETLCKEYEQKLSHFEELERVFRGKEFVDFLAEEQLVQVTKHASERLHTLTRGRYALVLDSSGGFMIADYFNGGEKRPASSLSGGETFLTSLALALSLSASIQLTGEKALEFFFLDEGFGTLDSELLDTVIHALEQLQTDHLAVGVISHVPELQERLQTRLIVTPATAEGKGSAAYIEY